jgi:hypothetical protein
VLACARTIWSVHDPLLSLPKLITSRRARPAALVCWLWLGLVASRAAAEPRGEEARELARIGIFGGAGYANERASDGIYGAGALRLTGFLPAHVSAELLLETLSSYDRTYSSRLPAADGHGLLQVPVSERMPRGRLQLGYELLGLWPAAHEAGRLVPFACGELLAFVNDVWPQRVLSFGGGLLGELRVHDGLRLMLAFSYLRAAHFADPAASRWLLFGALAGSVRMQFGAAFAIHPRARFELHYQGELLQYAHNTRVLDTLLFGPVLHLR